MSSILTTQPQPAGDHDLRESDVFPLPLSDFEHYMLVEDSTRHPMVITMVAHAQGNLQRDAFCQSLAEATRQHPLVRAQVSRVPALGTCWTEAAASLPEWRVDSDLDARIELPWIDIRSGSGLRVCVDWSAERSRVTFFFHHSCADGIAAVQFIGDVFARYGCRTGEMEADRPEVPGFAPQLLRMCEDSRAPDGARPGLWLCIREAFHFLFRKVSPLAASGTGSAGQTAIRTRVLGRDVSRSLKSVAAQIGVSINDLCTLEMAGTIVDWNDQLQGPGRSKRFRILVPLSMRTIAHDNLPVANVVSYLPMYFHRRELNNPGRFARRIHSRTIRSLETRYGLLFLKSIGLFRRIPGLLPLVVSGRNYYTAILANVGDVRRLFRCPFPQDRGRIVAGDITITRIDGVAPVRPNTRLAVSFGSYAGELIFNMRTDSTAISDEASEELFDQLVGRIQRLAESKSL